MIGSLVETAPEMRAKSMPNCRCADTNVGFCCVNEVLYDHEGLKITAGQLSLAGKLLPLLTQVLGTKVLSCSVIDLADQCPLGDSVDNNSADHIITGFVNSSSWIVR